MGQRPLLVVFDGRVPYWVLETAEGALLAGPGIRHGWSLVEREIEVIQIITEGGGFAEHGPLTPPPPLEIAREVPAMRAEDPGNKSCLPQEGVKFFSPHVSILKILRV